MASGDPINGVAEGKQDMSNETLRAMVARMLARADLPFTLVPALADLLKLDVEFNEGFLRLKEEGTVEDLEAALEVGEEIYDSVARAVGDVEAQGDFSALERAVAAANDDFRRLGLGGRTV